MRGLRGDWAVQSREQYAELVIKWFLELVHMKVPIMYGMFAVLEEAKQQVIQEAKS